MSADVTRLVILGGGSGGAGGGSAPTVISTAFSATLATSASSAPSGGTLVVQVGALTANITLSNPTSPTNRQRIEWVLVQNGTGGWTLTLDTKFRFPSSSTLSSPINAANSTDFVAASKKSRLVVEYDSADDKFDITAFIPGF